LEAEAKHFSVADWFDTKRAEEVVEAYNRGGGSALVADPFVARSLLPAGTGRARDFSYIAPELPELISEACVGCMDCVTNCPDTAILGKAMPRAIVDDQLRQIETEDHRGYVKGLFTETTKYYTSFEKKREKDPSAPEGTLFGIFIDPTKCKGCGECVEVCGDHAALKMIKKTPDNLPRYLAAWEAFNALPNTRPEHRIVKDHRDVMLNMNNMTYVGGAGSCMGCGEASVIRQFMAATTEVYGNNFGIVAATGCNTVYGSTYPYNPFLVPWTNSLFENAPADAMGIRSYWDSTGHEDWPLWVIGGDGAMLDIGFQSLSRLLTSGMNIKVLVLDTQVYSNTGGQTSTATFIGQEAKMSSHGKKVHGKTEWRKELGIICMMHPRTYVAQTVGPMAKHFYSAIQRANEFKGPAVINIFTTCQPEHGVADHMAGAQARLAVESRAFPVFTYDPDAGDTIKQCMSLAGNPSPNRDWHTRRGKDGKMEPVDFLTWARTEGRFRKHFDKDGNPTTEVIHIAQKERLRNWWRLQELAGVENLDRKAAAAPAAATAPAATAPAATKAAVASTGAGNAAASAPAANQA
jgi:pyruvate/2-oxoacid:ferredoxin oxidoreductase beta subunit/Pyruvate/2-oxoacid:ferredoxin oxidoreductase delta subunit